MDNNCLFCKIIKEKIPAKIIYRDDQCVAFHDIHPKSRIHLLIVPLKHLPTINDITENDTLLMGHLIQVAKNLAKEQKAKGYNLIFNVGKEAGQEIFHIHLHLLGK